MMTFKEELNEFLKWIIEESKYCIASGEFYLQPISHNQIDLVIEEYLKDRKQ